MAAMFAARDRLARLMPPSVPDAAAATAPSQTRTWRVGSGAGADAATITAAIAEARAGDMVVVEAGIYRESIALREGVTVISAQRHGAELRRPTNLAGPWTAVTASDITSAALRGFRIVGTSTETLDVGVLVRDAVASLEDLEITGAQDTAVRVVGPRGVILNADAEPVKP